MALFYTYPDYIPDKSDVHANHNEAQNAALRRPASAYRRRQNLYAKRVEGLQRTLDVQQLIHNWVRPHGASIKVSLPLWLWAILSALVPFMNS